MSNRIDQQPFFFTVSSGQTLVLNNTRAFTVYSAGGVTNVINSLDSGAQTLPLQTGLTLKVVADASNVISPITITPQSGATAYVSMLGGSGTIS